MPGARVFFDANVLIYIRDSSSQAKQQAAAQWLRDMQAASSDPLLSWQTLREYYSAVTRKGHAAKTLARQDIAAYRQWLVADPYDDFPEAWRIEDRYGFSFFDCLMVATALKADATHLLTEDLQHNQLVDGMRIVNPFRASFSDLT